jgi:tetratricopeptide (TPR) repeat protein
MEIDIPEDRAYPPFHFGQDIQTAPMLYLAWTCAYLGRIDEALQWTERAIDRARALQHPNTTGYVLIHNALVYGWLDLRDRLDDTMAEWRALDESEHVPVWRPFFLLVDAHRQCRREEWTAVIDTMAKIRTGYIEKIKLKAFIVEIYARAAQANIALGQYDDALALIEEGCEHSAETSEQFFLPDVLHQRAALASLQSSGDASTDQAWQDALAKAESTDAVPVKLQICTSYSQYLAKQGETEKAVALLREAIEAITSTTELPDVAKARKVLAAIDNKN